MPHTNRRGLVRSALCVATALSASLAVGLPASSASRAPRVVSTHAAVSVAPSKSTIGQLVVADVHKSTLSKGSSVKKLILNWGDGTAPANVKSLQTKPSHRYARAGHFAVTATLTDSKGKSSKATAAAIVTASKQSVYWTLFNGKSTAHQLQYVHLPLSATSTDTDITGNASNKLVCTAGMTTDAKGRLWVLSYYPAGCSASSPATIQVFNLPFTPSSAPVLSFTLPTTGDFDNLLFDHAGNLWVDNYSHYTVTKFAGPFTASGTLVPALTIALGVVKPSGLAFDAKGDLFVSNVQSAKTNSIAVYHAPITAATVPTFLNGLTGPGGLTFDPQGNLFASSNSSGPTGATIVRYNANNLSNGAVPNVVNHKGLSGGNYESNFAWDVAGNLYVADCGNHASIREYPFAASSFTASTAPNVNYTNSALSGIGCAWGIALH